MANKIHINDTTFEIPDRLTLDQYEMLLSFDWQDEKYYPLIVSKLTGAPAEQMSQAPEKALVLAMSLIIDLMNRRTEVDMLDLTNITFGQFIDLDVWLTMGLDKNFKSVCGLLCPAAAYADEAMYAIEKFAEFRVFTYRQYKVLFGITDAEMDIAIEEGAAPKDKLHVARSWYRVIVTLAGDDLLNIDAVTDEPLRKALNFMSYQKERVLEAQEKERQSKRKYDLLRHR